MRGKNGPRAFGAGKVIAPPPLQGLSGGTIRATEGAVPGPPLYARFGEPLCPRSWPPKKGSELKQQPLPDGYLQLTIFPMRSGGMSGENEGKRGEISGNGPSSFLVWNTPGFNVWWTKHPPGGQAQGESPGSLGELLLGSPANPIGANPNPLPRPWASIGASRPPG